MGKNEVIGGWTEYIKDLYNREEMNIHCMEEGPPILPVEVEEEINNLKLRKHIVQKISLKRNFKHWGMRHRTSNKSDE